MPAPRDRPAPRRLAGLLAMLALSASRVALAAEAPAEPAAARALVAIDAHVRASMARNRTPGLALALTDRRGLVALRTWGWADRKLRRPVTAGTRFQIGSISKSFTALTLLTLVEEGRLQLDAPVERYLPWFEVRSEFAPITVTHLLTHTAGIPANRDDVVSSPFMARALKERSTAWAPGSRFHYSNVGYQTLHALLERVAGESYAALVERRILRPLGMADSRAEITLESRGAQAVGYLPPYDDRPRHASRALVEAPHQVYRIGDGSVQSTAADLAAYVRMWLNRGRGPAGRIVAPASFERFATPHPGSLSEDGSRGYGLGIGVLREDGRELLRHSGGMVGFVAYARADMTDGLGVAVLLNGPDRDGSIAPYALAAWRAARAGAEPPDPLAALPAESVREAADYAGHFNSPAGAALEFVADGARLSLRRAGGGPIPLDPAGRDSFYSPDGAVDRYPFVFARDGDGRVVEVAHGAGWYVNSLYDGPRVFETPAAWSAFTGRYRSYSPWFPYFEILIRKGRLLAVTGEGGETASGETVLVPLGEALFQVGEEITPERLRFTEIVDGRALRAVWSGHPFFRQ